MKDFTKMVLESKDFVGFKNFIKEIVLKDSKAKQYLQAYRNDSDKMVDYVDYLMSRYEKEFEQNMNDFSINYEEAIDIIAKGI